MHSLISNKQTYRIYLFAILGIHISAYTLTTRNLSSTRYSINDFLHIVYPRKNKSSPMLFYFKFSTFLFFQNGKPFKCILGMYMVSTMHVIFLFAFFCFFSIKLQSIFFIMAHMKFVVVIFLPIPIDYIIAYRS